jgi:para-aminobenzoate synthetase component 1
MPINLRSFKLARFDPLKLFLRLAPEGPGFLETPEPTPRIGRYSIVALRSRESYRLDESGLVRLKEGRQTVLPGDPFRTLAEIHRDRQVAPAASPLPFCGGFFGYLGYDLAGWIEDLPRLARRDRPLPALWLEWVDLCAVFDHLSSTLTLASLDPGDDLAAL